MSEIFKLDFPLEQALVMKYISIIILITLTSKSFATGQSGEWIIYKGDTLEMLSEPLETFLRKNEPREKYYPFLKDGCSTALWRGYIGLWKITNNCLVLVDIFACGDKSKSIKENLFKSQHDEIFANWFNGDLFIEKGKIIKYEHSAYNRYYENEIVVSITNGVVSNVIEYQNGIKPDDNRFSRNPEVIQEEIYKRIGWDMLPELSKDKKLFVEIKINDQGEIKESEVKGKLEGEYRKQLEHIIKDFPIVQVFYSRGKPLNERWIMPIFFTNESKRKYNR